VPEDDLPVTGKSLFVYAEQPPLDENVPAVGLYRAGRPILGAIHNRIALIALYPMDRRYGAVRVDPSLKPLCRSLPHFFTLARTLRRRLFRDDLENGLIARLVGGWARRSSATQILALEGSDPEVLARVDAIAARAGLPFSVYMVDDHTEIMRRNGRTAAEIAAATGRMGESLTRARHVFAITAALGELLHRQFGVHPVTLPLAFEPGPRPAPPVKDQLFFLGSVNFLYADGLKSLIGIVGRLRAEMRRDLTLRLTSPGGTGALGPLPAFVNATPIAGAQALAAEIAASLFAFLPYSFDPALRTMVATSFPSKSMECLAYARSLVVHAPAYSNSARLFAEADLPQVTQTDAALEAAVRQHLQAPPDHSARYRTWLADHHAPEKIRRILLETLDR
jgi:hypothetical protein